MLVKDKFHRPCTVDAQAEKGKNGLRIGIQGEVIALVDRAHFGAVIGEEEVVTVSGIEQTESWRINTEVVLSELQGENDIRGDFDLHTKHGNPCP